MRKKSKNLSTASTNEQEQLNRTVDTTGNDPSPIVNALMSDQFVQASNLDVSQIALLLQELVRGQNSLLAQANDNQAAILRLQERQDKIDQEAVERHRSQQRDIADILNQAEKLKATGDQKDRIIAKGVQQYQQELVKARAGKSVERLEFEKRLAAEPQEYVVAHGQLITTIEHGQQVARVMPEEVRIKHKVWVLQPGIPTKVPASVAQVLRDRYKSQEQTNKLKGILGKHMEANKLAREWNETNEGKSAMPYAPG